MHCDQFRSALSARLDGEDPGVAPARLDEHLVGCADCRQFTAAARALEPRVAALAAAPVPDRSAALLARIAADRSAAGQRQDALRLALGVVALSGLVLAVPGLLVPGPGSAPHVLRELGVWDIALSIGFLLAAIQPVRALGLLPMAAALVVGLMVVAVADVAAGNTALLAESHHVLEVAGVLLLWRLARPLRGLTAVAATP